MQQSNKSHHSQVSHVKNTYSYGSLLKYFEAICADFLESNYNRYLSIYRTNFSYSSWITDASGAVNQHLQYLPFGEDYIYQRSNSWNIPYTFSGKEKDAETGL